MELIPIVDLVVTNNESKTYINSILKRMSEDHRYSEKCTLFKFCRKLDTLLNYPINSQQTLTDMRTLLVYLLKFIPVKTIFIVNCLDHNTDALRDIIKYRGQIFEVDGIYTDILLVIAKIIYNWETPHRNMVVHILVKCQHVKDLSFVDDHGLTYKLFPDPNTPIVLCAARWSIYLYQNYPKLQLILDTKQQIITFLTLRHCSESYVGDIPRELCLEIFSVLNL